MQSRGVRRRGPTMADFSTSMERNRTPSLLGHGVLPKQPESTDYWFIREDATERAPLLTQTPKANGNGHLHDSHRAKNGTTTTASTALHESFALEGSAQEGITWPTAAFLLVNAAMGAGLLNYPSAYDRAGGVGWSTVLQIVLILLLATTMIILVYCADLNGDNTYHDVLLSMCGKRAQRLAAVSIMLTCYGICVTFLIVIGDQYDRVFSSAFGEEFCVDWFLDRRFTISVTAVVCILPMCYLQRLDFLRYASTLGLFSMMYVVFLTIYQYAVLDVVPGPIRTEPQSASSFIAIIPVMCFAYQTHEVIVPVYACMERRRRRDFAKATALALSILFVLYCTAGTCGYLTFGSHVLPDVMKLYDPRDPLVAIGVLALVVKMITTYPPLLLCGRSALDGLYAEIMTQSKEEFIAGERRRRFVITTIWFGSTLLLAVLTPNIGVSIELLGSLAACNVFVFPGICLIQVVNRIDPDWDSGRGRALLLLAMGIVMTGAFMFGLILVQVIIDLRNGHPEELSRIC